MNKLLKALIRPALEVAGTILEGLDSNETGLDDTAGKALKNLAARPDLDALVDSAEKKNAGLSSEEETE